MKQVRQQYIENYTFGVASRTIQLRGKARESADFVLWDCSAETRANRIPWPAPEKARPAFSVMFERQWMYYFRQGENHYHEFGTVLNKKLLEMQRRQCLSVIKRNRRMYLDQK
jgi:hypothetical protein